MTSAGRLAGKVAVVTGGAQLIDGAAHTRRYPDLLAHLTAGVSEGGSGPS